MLNKEVIAQMVSVLSQNGIDRACLLVGNKKYTILAISSSPIGLTEMMANAAAENPTYIK